MRTYRAVWGTAAVAMVVVGVLGTATHGAGRASAVAGLSAAFVAMLALALVEDLRRDWGRVVQLTLAGGAAALLLDGSAQVLGGGGVALLALVVLLSPWVVDLGVTQARRARACSAEARTADPGAGGPRTTGSPTDRSVSAMTRDELVRRWGRTSAELGRVSPAGQRWLALVDERRRLLEELERRDPAGFDAWVASLLPEVRGDRRPRRGGRDASES